MIDMALRLHRKDLTQMLSHVQVQVDLVGSRTSAELSEVQEEVHLVIYSNHCSAVHSAELQGIHSPQAVDNVLYEVTILRQALH
jgi:hypothetical protein